MHKRYVTPKRLAAEIDTTEGALAMRRLRNQEPRYIKLGKKILYDTQDVERWLERHKIKIVERG